MHRSRLGNEMVRVAEKTIEALLDRLDKNVADITEGHLKLIEMEGMVLNHVNGSHGSDNNVSLYCSNPYSKRFVKTLKSIDDCSSYSEAMMLYESYDASQIFECNRKLISLCKAFLSELHSINKTLQLITKDKKLTAEKVEKAFIAQFKLSDIRPPTEQVKLTATG